MCMAACICIHDTQETEGVVIWLRLLWGSLFWKRKMLQPKRITFPHLVFLIHYGLKIKYCIGSLFICSIFRPILLHLFLCGWVLYLHVFEHPVCLAPEETKKGFGCLVTRVGQLWAAMWVLRIEHGSSGRAVISLTPSLFVFVFPRQGFSV